MSPKRSFDLGFLCLIQTLILISYLSFLRSQADLWETLILPVLCYLLGLYFVKSKELILALTAIATAVGVIYVFTTNQGKDCIIFFAIPLVSLLLAVVENKIKINKIILSIGYIIIALAYIGIRGSFSIRIAAIVQALTLLKSNQFGGITMDVFPGNTSSTMWLDYARDFGIFPLVFLSMFAVITLIVLIKLLLKKEKSFLQYILINLYIFLNMYYLLYSNARAHVYMWGLGLLVCGMIRGYLNDIDLNE